MAGVKKNDDPLQRLRHRVFKPIAEKIYLPLNRLLDRLGYTSSVLLLVAITGISALAVRLWNNPDEASRAITTMRFYVDARRSTPPRNPAVREVTRDLTNQLKDTMSPSNRNRVGVAGDWAEAQMAVSLRREDVFDPAELVEWFHTEWQTCQCWRAGPHDPPNLGATGWVLLAFASMRAKPTEREIDRMVAGLSGAGSLQECFNICDRIVYLGSRGTTRTRSYPRRATTTGDRGREKGPKLAA